MATELEKKLMDQKVGELLHRTPPTGCDCGCTVFKQGISVKVVSRTALSLSGLPAQSELVANIPILYCVKCLKVLELKPESVVVGGAS